MGMALQNGLRRRRKARQSYLCIFCAWRHPREGGKEVGITEVIAYKRHIVRMARLFEQCLGPITQHNYVTLWTI